MFGLYDIALPGFVHSRLAAVHGRLRGGRIASVAAMGALLPKAGPLMGRVKAFFGVLLLAVAIWIVSPVLPSVVTMLAWVALLVGTGVFLRAVDRLPADAGTPARLAKAVGILALVAGLALLVG